MKSLSKTKLAEADTSNQ